MKIVNCLFCGKKTVIQIINATKRIKGKVITVTNAPVYYCNTCNETFTSKEVQDVFRYIQDRNMDEGCILFNYDDMSTKIY